MMKVYEPCLYTYSTTVNVAFGCLIFQMGGVNYEILNPQGLTAL